MKILWVKSDFLHPTTKGGQIRTLEMLRRLHARHDVHYVGFEDRSQPEGLARSREYCSHAYPIRHDVPSRRSLKFLGQLVAGLWSDLPVSIQRYRSTEMSELITRLRRTEAFDAVVCDFLTPAVNMADLRRAVLFQHNVESVIWERSADQASGPAARWYLSLQARRMRAFEAHICRAVGHIVAVSTSDATQMRERFGVADVSEISTGVDVEYFAPREPAKPVADLIFVGSMDWLPNIDAMRFFTRQVLPLIRQLRPECSLAIVGRRPDAETLELAHHDPKILVTGTVPDVRPFLWGSKVSIVPLRIGGGTRLKIYEAMAARTPVVSTSIGAEGLALSSPEHFHVADTAEAFAERCVALLDDETERRRTAVAAWNFVSSRYSWEIVARSFESILEQAIPQGSGSK
ncbi:MAG TPA: glycosyltransferase [Vicinamibacterales bacterium]|nr:glycosyltransferase [Vicinamibacterales bacterium]